VSRVAILFLGFSFVACGVEPIDPRPDGGLASDLFPLAVGNTWQYRVTSGAGAVSEKVQTVSGTVAVGSETAFRLTTMRANERETTSVQIARDGVLLRLEEESYRSGVLTEHVLYDPGSIRVDSNHVRAGDVYESRHAKKKVDTRGTVLSSIDVVHRFTVESAGEPIDVPLGRFTAIRIKREGSDDSTKTYWFVDGIGKVKEIGGQTEELVRADLR
jgi:hypothetical protein